MAEKSEFEKRYKGNNPEADSGFQEVYEPQNVTLEELKERMIRLAEKEAGKE